MQPAGVPLDVLITRKIYLTASGERHDVLDRITALGVFGRGEPHHHGKVRQFGADRATGLDPRAIRESDVHDHDVRQMTARLLAANKSENPILLRTSSSAGHGIGTALSERIKQSADIYAFLFAQLGMSGKRGD